MHTQATHSPAPVSGHASHITASPPALCPPAATLWTSHLQRHQLNTPDSDAATLIPPPTFTPPSQHPPPTAPTHVPSLPQPPPPPLPTTTHASNITTSTARKYRNPPLPPQLPPSPLLPPTTHASNASTALTRSPSAIYRPRPPALSSTPPPLDSTHRATAANTTALALASHQPHPAQPPWPDLILTAINAAASAPTPRATPPPQHHHPHSCIPPTPSRPTALAQPCPSISSFMYFYQINK
ncbi:hypothetical protein EDB85DRAFT_2149961 [Lactarius pseudohatsudake]|nr:hypothetical protein EDB85DRAFT_2149961 [Lactarius pseudohatsudake]